MFAICAHVFIIFTLAQYQIMNNIYFHIFTLFHQLTECFFCIIHIGIDVGEFTESIYSTSIILYLASALNHLNIGWVRPFIKHSVQVFQNINTYPNSSKTNALAQFLRSENRKQVLRSSDM